MPASLYVAIIQDKGVLYKPFASLRYRVLITSTVVNVVVIFILENGDIQE